MACGIGVVQFGSALFNSRFEMLDFQFKCTQRRGMADSSAYLLLRLHSNANKYRARGNGPSQLSE